MDCSRGHGLPKACTNVTYYPRATATIKQKSLAFHSMLPLSFEHECHQRCDGHIVELLQNASVNFWDGFFHCV